MRTNTSKEQQVVRLSKKERDYIFSVTMKYLHDEDAAADATQDAMLLAFRHAGSFRGDSKLTTWLYRIAATTALMHLRKQRRAGRFVQPRQDEDGEGRDLLEIAAPGTSPEEKVGAREAMGIAASSLFEMGDKYAPVFALRFADGYSEAEIAVHLNLNVATVKTRAHRARTRLRQDILAEIT